MEFELKQHEMDWDVLIILPAASGQSRELLATVSFKGIFARVLATEYLEFKKVQQEMVG